MATTSAVSECPTCSAPTLGSVCHCCAFKAALQGLAVAGTDLEALEEANVDLIAPEGYELVREIGTGATAVVWLAREQKLDRLVALKLISAAGDRRLLHRLIREGQAAARLRHPHIITVHTLGETKHHAYLAMDFLEGGDLRARLAGGLLAPHESAELARNLASALAHAHANGILHRDIKPSNVLLDARGEPHLGDFGLAAPLQGGGDLTLPGQVAGTAAYLAPELLAGADRASPQSDVYGLGAVLYECLAGRAPFIGDSAAAIFAQLRDVEPPAPRMLRPDIPRDLETICLKCLEKNPARRYVSAEALQDDLERFLGGESIAARPVGMMGKSFRWCRRNPLAASFATVSVFLLLCLAFGGPLVALRLARAKAQAAEEAAASKAVSEFLQKDLLAQAAPDHQPNRELKLRTVLDRAAKNIDGRFPQQPLVEADVRATLATTYISLGEFGPAREQWERVRHLRQRELGAENVKTLQASAGLFNALRMLGKFREAESLALEVIPIQRRVLGPDHPDTLQASNNLAAIYRQLGKLAAAEALYVELRALAQQRLGAEHATTLSIINNLALVYQEEAKYAEAEALHRERLAICQRLLGLENPSTLTSLYNLALVCTESGKLGEAESLCVQTIEARTRVLGPEHPDTLHAQRVLAWIVQDLGRSAEAEALDLQIIAAQERTLGPQHPDTLVTKFNLGRLYREQGKLTEAENLVAETLAIRERVLGPHSPFTVQSMSLLAGIYGDTRRLSEATRLAAEAVAEAERSLNPGNSMRVLACAELGKILLTERRFAEAEPLLRTAFEHYPKTPAKAWRAATLQCRLGEALLGLKRYEEAEPSLLRSYETLKRNISAIPPANQSDIAATAAQIAQLYTEWSQPDKARTWQTTMAALAADR